MSALADKGIKTVTKTVLHMHKKLSGDVEDIIKMTYIKPLEMKTVTCELKNPLDGISRRCDIAEEK